jgi:hypothetical protein
MSQDSQVFHLISVYIKSVQWNPSKQNLVGTNFCVRNRQVFGLYRLNYIGTLFKVGFIQDFNLFRVQFRQVSLYLVIFVLVYKVKPCLFRTQKLVPTKFCLEGFHCTDLIYTEIKWKTWESWLIIANSSHLTILPT